MAGEDAVPTFVLDAFPLMAVLGGEPGAAAVIQRLKQARDGRLQLWMCVVNLGEVIYNFEDRYGTEAADLMLQSLSAAPIALADADLSLTREAARLKARARRGRQPLSYADAFAAALTQQLDATLITGDREFEAFEDLVKIEWLTTEGR